ncbi:MAG: hypothetical protein PUG24_01795 [Eubacteriales bacterium]|nr:hypothetical protein [Eubacteriales bacterium]
MVGNIKTKKGSAKMTDKRNGNGKKSFAVPVCAALSLARMCC